MAIPAVVSWGLVFSSFAASVALAWGAWPVAAPAALPPARRSAPPPALVVAVDASGVVGGLVHATIMVPCRPGRLWLRYPRWIPGTHAPCGPIQNLVDIRVHAGAADGAPLAWARDPRCMTRFAIDVPGGCTAVAVSLAYIANQPTVNSQPVDVLCRGGIAAINWNDVLLYPEGWPDDSIPVTASLRLPTGWTAACALDPVPGADGIITYTATTLRDLVDAPVLAGRDLAVHEIPVARFPGHRLAVAAATGSAGSAASRQSLQQLRAVAAEARELFGHAPFRRYTWLLGLGSSFPHLGLEHQSSSLDGLGADVFQADGQLGDGAAFLLAHEYGHAWCGKQHRPAGMLTRDFHTDKDTRLLWVYEGFDEYIGFVLAGRSGAVSRQQWLWRMSWMVGEAAENRSRAWRDLEDTAAASALLRGSSQHFDGLRGGQDYYVEGMLLCLECDGLIRRASGGVRSFDDVLRILLVPTPAGSMVPMTEADVVTALHTVEPGRDWQALIDRRVRRTSDPPDMSGLAAWGMRLVGAADGSRAQAEPSDDPADRAILDAILAPRSAEGRAGRRAAGW